jgi:hypothetical protein
MNPRPSLGQLVERVRLEAARTNLEAGYDAIGPYEVLQRIPAFDITFVGHARGEVRSDNGMLGLVIDGTFEDLPSPDVIIFPGGWARAHCSPTRGYLTGCGARTPAPPSPPRSAPAPSCSARRACSTA